MRENVPWLILEKKEGRVKLISEYVLDWSGFNHTLNCKWADLDLRKWLQRIDSIIAALHKEIGRD